MYLLGRGGLALNPLMPKRFELYQLSIRTLHRTTRTHANWTTFTFTRSWSRQRELGLRFSATRGKSFAASSYPTLLSPASLLRPAMSCTWRSGRPRMWWRGEEASNWRHLPSTPWRRQARRRKSTGPRRARTSASPSYLRCKISMFFSARRGRGLPQSLHTAKWKFGHLTSCSFFQCVFLIAVI